MAIGTDPSWLEIVEVYSEKLRLYKEKLESSSNDRDTDQFIKGQIAAVKELLNFKTSRDKRILAGTGRVP